MPHEVDFWFDMLFDPLLGESLVALKLELSRMMDINIHRLCRCIMFPFKT